MKSPWIVLAVALDAATLGAQVRLEGRVIRDGEAVQGAVVYLVPSGRPASPLPPRPAVIDQRDLRFTPRVLVVPPGSPVDFLNSDSLRHNVFSPAGPSGPFDLGTYQAGERRTQVFTGTGTSVILCHVHPEMVAYVVSVPTEWHAQTDGRGTYELGGVPTGRYDVFVAYRRRHVATGSIAVGATGTQRLDLAIDRGAAGVFDR